jgi:prepilin-type N-terminal cleavage/methylation domain-containing protein
VKDESGFTLLEVLVALTIMAVGVSLALSLIFGSLGNIRKVRMRAHLIDQAKSVMELVLLDDEIQGATTRNGDFEDGTRWTVAVTEVEMPAPQNALPIAPQSQLAPPLVLSYDVQVMAPDATKPDFELKTMKLVNPPTSIPGAIRVP